MKFHLDTRLSAAAWHKTSHETHGGLNGALKRRSALICINRRAGRIICRASKLAQQNPSIGRRVLYCGWFAPWASYLGTRKMRMRRNAGSLRRSCTFVQPGSGTPSPTRWRERNHTWLARWCRIHIDSGARRVIASRRTTIWRHNRFSVRAGVTFGMGRDRCSYVRRKPPWCRRRFCLRRSPSRWNA